MNFSKEKKLLEYFNQNVNQLQDFNFWKNFPSTSGYNISFDYTESETKINSKILGPNNESISAFILKYRLFIQDKDDISLRNLEKLFLNLPVENKFKERYKNL